jgi:mono/diheme cytochrome c family protein
MRSRLRLGSLGRRVAAIQAPILWAFLGGVLLLASAGPPASSTRADSSKVAASVTFSGPVVRILQQHCQACHHAGGIGPFPLMTYADAFKHRSGIRKMTGARAMPPWSVEPGCAAYQDDPSLTPGEIEAIGRWVQRGAPEGNPRDLPPPKKFPSRWALGEPDLKLTMKTPYPPDFSHGDEFRCFVFPTPVAEDRWVAAVALLPGNPKMVHHALLWIEKGSESEKRIGKDPYGSYPCAWGAIGETLESIGEWVPGSIPHRFPEGVGRLFPKRSRVILQVHYSAHYAAHAHTNQPDQTSVGIYFSKAPVRHRVRADWVYGPDDFVIPAGAKNYTLKNSLSSLPAMELFAVWPHMHLLGQTMTLTATLPNGEQRCLFRVRDWDFHWQRTYWLREPMTLPKGTRFDLTATYDNSSANPNNPSNPPRDARYGMATTNEMCQAALYYIAKDQTPVPEKPARVAKK